MGVLPDGVETPLTAYRNSYQPSLAFPEPRIAMQVWSLAADTEVEARHLFRSRAYWRVQMRRGERTPLVDPDAADIAALSETERTLLAAADERHVVGTAADVAQRLSDLADRFGVNELVLPTWTFDPAATVRSFELIAHSFGMGR